MVTVSHRVLGIPGLTLLCHSPPCLSYFPWPSGPEGNTVHLAQLVQGVPEEPDAGCGHLGSRCLLTAPSSRGQAWSRLLLMPGASLNEY